MEAASWRANDDVFREQFRQLERRLTESEQDRRDIWKSQGAVDRAMARQEERMEHLEKLVEGISKRMAWVVGALFTLSGTFLISAITIVLTIR